VYAFLCEQCHIALQQKIEALSDYKSAIKVNPMEQANTQNAPNYQEHGYLMSIILDAMKNLTICKQTDGE
jgi:hypothetical protein